MSKIRLIYIKQADLDDLGDSVRYLFKTDKRYVLSNLSKELKNIPCTVTADKVFKDETFISKNGKETGTFTIDDELVTEEDLINRMTESLKSKVTGIVPSGSLKITNNGPYDVREKAMVDVQIDITSDNVILETLDATENKAYIAPENTAYSQVNVNVPPPLTQEKAVDITENGTTEVTPDEGYLLSKVTANVNVGGGENKLAQVFNKTVTEITEADLRGTTMLPQQAFYQCKNLTSVAIPNSVTSIGSSAFNYCTSLANVTIPDSVTSIGSSAFYNCTQLASINIPNGVPTIDQSTFAYCTSLVDIAIPDSVITIGNSAFERCTKLTSVKIGTDVTSIGGWAFSTCSKLASVKIYATTPPSLQSAAFLNILSTCRFEVPAESVEAYKAATNWSTYADQIFAIEE